MINWQEVIQSIQNNPGHVIDFNTSWNESNPEYNAIVDMLVESNVDLNTARWINYYPGKDFDESVVTEFAEQVGRTPIRAWISKVTPGNFVPYHWDVDDNEQEYLKLGKLVRFSCFIAEPVVGQVIMIGDEYLYSQPQGTVYEWPDYKAWHASTNASLAPKYLFHFLGY